MGKKSSAKITAEEEISEQQRRLLIFREWVREEVREGEQTILAIAKKKGIPKTTFYNTHNGNLPISNKLKLTLEKAFNKSM